MSLRVIFKSSARAEFIEAIGWYELQRPGLGSEFALEIAETLRRAQTNPECFSKVRGEARKIHLRRFSHYNIYFAVKEEAFSVLAVFHSSRNPSELRRRLG
jgi:toxin ParE1/3/4